MKTSNKPEASTQSVKLKWVLPDKPQMIFLVSLLVLSTVIMLNGLLDFPSFLRGAKTNPIDWIGFATEMSAIMLVTFSGSVLLRKAESKRQLAEEALKESEEKYRALIEAAGRAGEGIIIIQDKGEDGAEFVFVNDQFCRMSGYSRVELAGRSPWELVPREISVQLKDWYRRRHMGESLPSHYEAAGVRKDGTIVPLELSIVTMPWQGKIATVLYLRNITERKQAEKALRESEGRFRQLAENIDQVFWLTDWENDKLLYVNPSYEKMFGRSCQSVYQDRLDWYQVIHPDDRDRVKELLVKNAQIGQNTAVEYRIIRDDGEVRWILDRNYPIRNKDGKVYRIVSIAEDISERKRAEKKLVISEQFLNSVIENTPNPMWISDKKGTVIRMNQALRDLLKITDEEVIGKYNVLKDNQVMEQRLLPLVTGVFEKGKTVEFEIDYVTSREKQLQLKEETHKILDIIISPIKDSQGKIVNAVAQHKDVTERKRAEEALRLSEDKFSKAFHASPDILVISRLSDGAIIEANDQWDQLFGYKKWETIGRSSLEMGLFVNSEDRQRATTELKEQGFVRNFEIDVRGKSDEIRQVILSVEPIEINSEPCMLTIIHDITERKRAEEALRKSQAELQSIFSAAPAGIGMTIDQTIQELNTHLCEISGYSKEELLGKNISMVYPSYEDFFSTKDEIYKQLKENEYCSIETSWKRKDGKLIYVLLNCAPLSPGDFSQGITFAVIDITERKRVEEAIRMERDRLDEVTGNIGAGLAIVSKDYRTIWANRVLKEIFCGVEGKICYSTYNQQNQICPGCGVREVFKTGKDKVVSEQVGKDKDGNTIWSQIVATPIRDQNGNVTAALELVVPITERKNTENALRESEKRFRQIAESAGEWIWETDAQGLYTYASPIVEKILGFKPEEIVGKKYIYDLFVPDSREELKKLALDIFAKKKPIYRLTNANVHKNGDIVFLETSGLPVLNEKGDLLGYRGADTDITERKRVEQELKDSHARLSTIFHYSPIAIAITRLQDNQLMDVNEAWQRITGYTREEAIGRNPIELGTWVDPAQRNQLVRQLQKGGVVWNFESKTRHRSGTVSDILLTADLITLGGESYMLSLAYDITEKKKMEAQLIQSERLAAVGTLAYGIAHEFNNILAGILGNAEYGLISRKRGELEKCLRIIMENCDRAKSITNNLLAFSTHQTVRKEEAGVADAVESVLSLVERELEKKNVKVARKFDAVPNIYCDIGELSQVVLNMVTNARDAMTPKGGTLTVEISKLKDNIKVIFSDTGCGIPNSIKSRIFEPFVTTKGALGQSEIPGTGLGLFLSYGIISRYGGKIEVESKVGRGSRFTISIPISINQTPPDVPIDEERLLFVPENLNILLVDDEEPILSSIQSFLETKGHTVVTTSSGKKGLRLFKDGSFDLVLSDITMPDMDGLELISKLKNINERVKLIALTGHLEEEKLKSAQKAGADQVLIKPFRNEELYRIIARALSS